MYYSDFHYVTGARAKRDTVKGSIRNLIALVWAYLKRGWFELRLYREREHGIVKATEKLNTNQIRSILDRLNIFLMKIMYD